MANEAVLAELLKLPADEREELRDRLDESLQAEPDDPEHIAAWTAVIDRRVEEIRSGKAQLVPASDVFRRAREVAGRR